ncbi:hypothetical protein [Telmatospirillum sp. J64-1]|uniref:capsid assembly protein n=1 Tax=Telmatospirillum sp. J64-1 TaxID=2502183 RepID=UPI00115D6D69|nr:hypothetical protein [Telmatospirillum sp. J64-1]
MSAEQFQVPAQEAPPEAPSSQQQSGDRPSWLPEKFNSPEELAKAYRELEGKLGQQQPQEQPPQQQQEDPSQLSPEELNERFVAAGLDLAKFYEEYRANNGLSEESYQTLAQQGFSRQFIDGFIEGQHALAEKYVNSIYEQVGGEQGYKALAQWAQTNLSPKEIETFNRICDDGDLELLQLAVQGLYAKFTAANGKEPKMVHGQATAPQTGFKSMYEMKEAMKDQRYGKDPAYMNWIEDMIRNSTF